MSSKRAARRRVVRKIASTPQDARALATPGAPSQLAIRVARLAAEDPDRARLFLQLLRRAARTGRPATVQRVIRAFGSLGSTIAEAALPTPLTTRPARLADSWNTVGRLLGSSMQQLGEQHDNHV